MKQLTGQELIDYLNSLQDGERVRETSRSALYGREGVVYRNESGLVCVRWDEHFDEAGQLSTTVTGGTRRVSDMHAFYFSWIASHLTHVRLGIDYSHIEWIDDAGISRLSEIRNARRSDEQSDEQLLRHVIDMVRL